MKRSTAVFYFVAITTAVWSPMRAVAKEPNPEEKVWVSMQPVDCLGNPWEKNWLAHHKNQVGKYPRAQEIDILKGFFHKNGITILDYRTKPYVNGDPLCKTCGCPRGDTLLLMVSGVDVPKLRTFGFQDPVPDDLLDKKSPKHANN